MVGSLLAIFGMISSTFKADGVAPRFTDASSLTDFSGGVEKR